VDLIVRVRGVGDASLTSVFRPLLAASAAATRHVEADVGKIGKAAARGASEGAAAHKRAGREVEGVYRKLGTAAEEWAKASEKAQDAAHRKALANIRELEREQRAAVARQGREAQRAQSQIPSAALRTFGGYLRAAGVLTKDIAGAFGADLSLAGGIGRGVALESAAVAIANKGNRGGAVEDPKKLEELARSTGDMFRVDPTRVLAGLDKFQSLTGDLSLGKIALKDLVGLSRAFKIDIDQLIGSAGNVATKIGDVGKEFKTPEEKAARLLDVVKSLVAQGQEGAIEMPDLVTQLSALGAAAPRFEGSAAANISKMGAMAQLALQMGGAKSASQATTAVMGFANTLSTPARRAQFKAMGVDIDSTSEKGKFLDPFEIIKQSLLKTGGDTDKMKKLFANVVGERAVRALTNSYLGAGGGQAGLAAVDKQFARFGGTVNDKQIQDNLGRELGTKASEAQAFQNELDKITSTMGDQLAPAMKDLAPVAKDAARSLTGLVSFGASHPETAITAAIVASIGKAALGPAIGEALKNSVGGAGALGGILALGVVALSAEKVIFDAKDKANDRVRNADLRADDAEAIARGAKKTGTVTAKDKSEFDATLAETQARVAGAKEAYTPGVSELGPLGNWLMAAKNFVTGGPDLAGINAREKDAANLPALEQKLAALQAQKDAVQNAKISNAGEIGTAVASALAPLINASAPGPTVNTAAQSGGVH